MAPKYLTLGLALLFIVVTALSQFIKDTPLDCEKELKTKFDPIQWKEVEYYDCSEATDF